MTSRIAARILHDAPQSIERRKAAQKPFYEDARFIGWSEDSGRGPGGKKKQFVMWHKKTDSLVFFGRDSAKEAINDLKHLPLFNGKSAVNLSDNFWLKMAVEMDTKARERKQRMEKYGLRSPRWRRSGHSLRILEVGANIHPDIAATHAIDIGKFRKSDIRAMEEKVGKIKYAMGYNINRRILPYKDNFFDVVMSFSVLGAGIGTGHTYKEILRILKPGGRLEIGVGEPKLPHNQKYIRASITQMKNELGPLGFTNIHTEIRGGDQWGLMVAEKPGR